MSGSSGTKETRRKGNAAICRLHEERGTGHSRVIEGFEHSPV